MRIVFRADASQEIGSGHVMRCLTLADELRDRQMECHFIIRQQPGDMAALVRSRGHEVHLLTERASCNQVSSAVTNEADDQPAHSHWLKRGVRQDAFDTTEVLERLSPDWLVVDHYGIDRQWEEAIRKYCGHLMVIDDLADRPHSCDLLLDQNLGREVSDYVALVPDGCRICAGPSYALLRPEFRKARARIESKSPASDHLLINLGGVDKDNVTGALLHALRGCDLQTGSRISIVMGKHAPCIDSVKEQALTMPWEARVLVGVNNMAELMADADLALGAAGGTAWERCCLGLPSILVILAENQRSGALALAESGAAVLGGSPEQAVSRLCRLLSEARSRRSEISAVASSLCDGEGASRIADALMELAR